MENTNINLSRRRFLRQTAILAGVVGSGVVLVACGDNTATSTLTPVGIDTVTPTAAVNTTSASTSSNTTSTLSQLSTPTPNPSSTGGNGKSKATPAANAKSDPNFADVGTLADFDTTPKSIQLTPPKNGTQETVFIVKSGNQFIALSDKCTHQGCEVSWVAADTQFECPCHGSTYDMQGKVTGGPAPRSLDRFKTKVVTGHLMVSYQHTKAG